MAISIDERDQAALADQESERDQDVIGGVTIERVNVTKRVCRFLIHVRVIVRTNLNG